MVQVLLNTNADVNTKNSNSETALHYAATLRTHGKEIVTMLVEAGADVNAQVNSNHVFFLIDNRISLKRLHFIGLPVKETKIFLSFSKNWEQM